MSKGYFATLEIPLVRGRAFDSGDRRDSGPVAIINEAMAARFWPGQDPVGQRLQTDAVDEPVREVVGVVGNVKQDRYQRDPQPQIYVPRLQMPLRMDNAAALQVLMGSVVVKTAEGASGAEVALRRAVQEVVPGVPVSRVRSVEEYASGQVRDLRRASVLLSTFAVIAAALALIGIFGVVTHLVRQRSIELGIRMALGAARRDVLSLVLRQGFTVIIIGLVLGTAGAFALLRVAQGVIHGVTTTDPLSFVGALVVLTVVGLLGCYLPARRASKIEPVIALRRD